MSPKQLGTASYSATKSKGVITLTASGQNNSRGYKNLLEQGSKEHHGAPEFSFYQVRPNGFVSQVISPFRVSVRFRSHGKVKHIHVIDAHGTHKVKVQKGGHSHKPERPPAQYQPTLLRGKLRTGFNAIGSETTGVRVGRTEVDFGRNLNAALGQLNGHPVTVTGKMTTRRGVTSGSRKVFVVNKLILVGKLNTRVFGIGGESTGYTVHGLEVDFGRNANRQQIKQLNGRTVAVHGNLTLIRGVERTRLVLNVYRLQMTR